MRIYKKYKESNQLTLHCGDCLDLLKTLPDASVDLVMTSSPYCIGKAYKDPRNDIEYKSFRFTTPINTMAFRHMVMKIAMPKKG